MIRLYPFLSLFLIICILGCFKVNASEYKFQADGQFHYFGFNLTSDSVITIKPKFPVGSNSNSRLAMSIDSQDRSIENGGSPNYIFAETWYKSNDGEISTPTPIMAGNYTLRVQDLTYGHGVDKEVVIELSSDGVNSSSGNEHENDSISTGTELIYGYEYSGSVGFKKVYNNYDNVYSGVTDSSDYYIFSATEDGELKVSVLVNDFNPGYPHQNGYLEVYVSDTPHGYNLKRIAWVEANGTYTETYTVTKDKNYYISVSNSHGAWAAYSLDTDFTSTAQDTCLENMSSCGSLDTCTAANGYWYNNSCNASPQSDGNTEETDNDDGSSNDGTTNNNIETLFSEDFESYLSVSLITSMNNWKGDSGYVNSATYMSTNVFDSRYDVGADTYNVIYRALDRTLLASETVTMSFDAYATMDAPMSHNTAIGLGNGSALKVFWNPEEDTPGNGKWVFDARSLTGDNSSYESISGGYDVAVSLKIVIDGANSQVYGIYNFGSGEVETSRFPINTSAIEALNTVYLYADYRSPTAASTSYGTRFEGIELDNILVTTNSASSTEASETTCISVSNCQPVLTISTNGVNVFTSWTAIPDAQGYILNYAPYPYMGPETIGRVDLGMLTSYSVNLWSGASFYVAIQAYNGGVESEFSNIELFKID